MNHSPNCNKDKQEAISRQSKGMIGVFMPRCNSDGTWQPLQCWGSTGMCHCVDPRGKITVQPSRGLDSCPGSKRSPKQRSSRRSSKQRRSRRSSKQWSSKRRSSKRRSSKQRRSRRSPKRSRSSRRRWSPKRSPKRSAKNNSCPPMKPCMRRAGCTYTDSRGCVICKPECVVGG